MNIYILYSFGIILIALVIYLIYWYTNRKTTEHDSLENIEFSEMRGSRRVPYHQNETSQLRYVDRFYKTKDIITDSSITQVLNRAETQNVNRKNLLAEIEPKLFNTTLGAVPPTPTPLDVNATPLFPITQIDASSFSSFDPRIYWNLFRNDSGFPDISLIQQPENQGICGSCWAYATVSSLSDRYRLYVQSLLLRNLNPTNFIDMYKQAITTSSSFPSFYSLITNPTYNAKQYYGDLGSNFTSVFQGGSLTPLKSDSGVEAISLDCKKGNTSFEKDFSGLITTCVMTFRFNILSSSTYFTSVPQSGIAFPSDSNLTVGIPQTPITNILFTTGFVPDYSNPDNIGLIIPTLNIGNRSALYYFLFHMESTIGLSATELEQYLSLQQPVISDTCNNIPARLICDQVEHYFNQTGKISNDLVYKIYSDFIKYLSITNTQLNTIANAYPTCAGTIQSIQQRYSNYQNATQYMTQFNTLLTGFYALNGNPGAQIQYLQTNYLGATDTYFVALCNRTFIDIYALNIHLSPVILNSFIVHPLSSFRQQSGYGILPGIFIYSNQDSVSSLQLFEDVINNKSTLPETFRFGNQTFAVCDPIARAVLTYSAKNIFEIDDPVENVPQVVPGYTTQRPVLNSLYVWSLPNTTQPQTSSRKIPTSIYTRIIRFAQTWNICQNYLYGNAGPLDLFLPVWNGPSYYRPALIQGAYSSLSQMSATSMAVCADKRIGVTNCRTDKFVPDADPKTSIFCSGNDILSPLEFSFNTGNITQLCNTNFYQTYQCIDNCDPTKCILYKIQKYTTNYIVANPSDYTNATVNLLKQYLLEGPLVIAIEVYNSFFDPTCLQETQVPCQWIETTNANFIYTGPTQEELASNPEGGHALTLVGWAGAGTLQTSRGPYPNPCWLIRNSWGSNWSKDGYFYADIISFANYIQQAVAGQYGFQFTDLPNLTQYFINQPTLQLQ